MAPLGSINQMLYTTPEVQATFVEKTGTPTIVKRRYVDAYTKAKMMGVYHLDDFRKRGVLLEAPDRDTIFLRIDEKKMTLFAPIDRIESFSGKVFPTQIDQGDR